MMYVSSRKKGLEDVKDKDGNTPVQYLSGRTPISAIKVLKDFDTSNELAVSFLSVYI